MRTKLVIFDFDGTIADTSEGIIQVCLASLKKMGLPPSTPEKIKASIGLPLGPFLVAGSGVPEERMEEGMKTYRELFFEIAGPYICLFDGVKEALLSISESGRQLAIATSRGRNSLTSILREQGLFGIFGEIVCADNALPPKPAPDMVKYILERTGVPADEAIVIGDTTFDLLMGKGAGCRTCGVSYGNHSAEMLATAEPDFIINNMSALPELLD